MDGINSFVIAIVWNGPDASKPTIEAKMFPVAKYPADPDLKAKVDESYKLIDNMRHTQLTVVPKKFRSHSQAKYRNPRGKKR